MWEKERKETDRICSFKDEYLLLKAHFLTMFEKDTINEILYYILNAMLILPWMPCFIRLHFYIFNIIWVFWIDRMVEIQRL